MLSDPITCRVIGAASIFAQFHSLLTEEINFQVAYRGLYLFENGRLKYLWSRDQMMIALGF